MVELSLSELSKNPALLDTLEEIAEVKNRKTRSIKGYFIPARFEERFRELLEELDYESFKARNRSLGLEGSFDDATLSDGLD
ncbi:hypothetical protein [Nitratifractor sp.]